MIKYQTYPLLFQSRKGPFVTELDDEDGDKIRTTGNEFGAITARSHRIGWLDLPALKYAVMLNGVTQLVMTKADVLSDLDKIFVCTHYEYRGEITDYMPGEINNYKSIPLLKEMMGWKKDITTIKHTSEIPEELLTYIQLLESELGVPIKYLSVGPDRMQTLVFNN